MRTAIMSALPASITFNPFKAASASAISVAHKRKLWDQLAKGTGLHISNASQHTPNFSLITSNTCPIIQNFRASMSNVRCFLIQSKS